MQFLQLLSRPKEFFVSIHEQEPSLKWPAILVTIMAVLSAIVGYQMGELTGRMFSGMAPGMGTFIAAISMIGAFIASYFMWVVAFVIFYALHRLFKGTGSIKRVAEVTGYGMLPLILSSVVGIILAIYYLPMVHISTVTMTDPEKINAAVQGMVLDPALHQFTIINSIISIILMIWAVNLWTFGFEICCGLDNRKAMITAGIPVLLYIVYILASLFVFTPGNLA